MDPNSGPKQTGPPQAAPEAANASIPEASSQTNHLNVLVVGADLSFAKMVQTAFQSVAPDNTDKNFRIFPGINKEKMLEYIAKYPLHSILVEEESILDTTPDKYLKDMRDLCKQNPANAAVPVVFIASQTDSAKTRALVKLGWKDVLLKPLDKSLFLQKMNLYNPGLPVLKEAILFTMDLSKAVDLSFTFQTKSISEYGMKVDSNKPLDVGLVMGVVAPFLDTPLSAVVLDCVKITEESYMIGVMFVGITPAETQVIRKMIRTEYAEEKQAA